VPFTEALTTVRPDTGVSTVYPQLATEWTISPDARTYTIKLRKGVQFHFGKGEFTVKDVINAIDHSVLPESLTTCRPTYTAFMGAKSATEMKEKGNLIVVDDYTFTMKLARPQIDVATWWFNNMTFQICAPSWSSAQQKAEGNAMFERKPAGTGPYQIVRRTLKEFTEYERVPYKHWRVDPEFKTLRITTAPEELTRLAMLLTKEADMADVAKVLHDQAINAGMVVLESDLPSVGLTIIPHGQYYVSGVNYKPEDDPWAAPGETGRLVRQALNKAVNREQLINVLFKGIGESMYVTAFHPSLEGWNPRWEQEFKGKYGYDPEGARKLLDQAGYPGDRGKNRFKLEVMQTSLPGLPETIEVAQALAQDFTNVGIDVKLTEIEFARTIDAFRDRHDAHFFLPLRITLRPVMQNIQLYYYTGPIDPAKGIPTRGAIYVEVPIVEKVYEALLTETDPAKRNQLALDAGNIIYDEFRTIPVIWLNVTLVVNPNVVAEYHFGSATPVFYFLEYAKAVK